MVDVAHVLEDADEQADVTRAEHDDSGDGPTGVGRLLGGHSEPDQAAREQEASDDGGKESVLGRGHVGWEPVRHALVVKPVAEADHDDAEDAAEGDGEEHEARLLEGEVVGRLEDPEEDTEEDEEDAEHEGDVQRQEADDGLRDQHVQGAEERDRDELLHGRSEGGSSGLLQAEFLSASALDCPLVSLIREHDQEDAEEREQGLDVLRPAPAVSRHQEHSDDGAIP